MPFLEHDDRYFLDPVPSPSLARELVNKRLS